MNNKKSTIIILVLLLAVSTLAYLSLSTPSSTSQNSIQKKDDLPTAPTISNPIAKSDIIKSINTKDQITRCLINNDKHYNEYHLSNQNILMRSWYPHDQKVEESNILVISNSAYLWTTNKSIGTTINIPTNADIKSNPDLSKPLKYIPTLETFQPEAINDIEKIGYSISCEIIQGEQNIFRIPDIEFKTYDATKDLIY